MLRSLQEVQRGAFHERGQVRHAQRGVAENEWPPPDERETIEKMKKTVSQFKFG